MIRLVPNILINDLNQLAVDNDLFFFDLETTGVFPLSGDKLIEIALIKWPYSDKNLPKNKDDIPTDLIYHSLVNPERPIPHSSSLIHGINTQHVQDKPTIEELLPSILHFITQSPAPIIIGHNIKEFDLLFLNHVLYTYHFPLYSGPIIDTLVLSQNILNKNQYSLKNYKLDTLREYFHISETQEHRALDDCYLNLHIFFTLEKIFSKSHITTEAL